MRVRQAAARIAGSKWLRWLGAACVLAIAVLSLAPKDWKGIDSPVAHGTTQHFMAYLITAAVIALGARRRLNPALVIAGLATYAGVLEVLQNWSPGRDPGLEGFISSSLGAAVGALAVFGSRRS